MYSSSRFSSTSNFHSGSDNTRVLLKDSPRLTAAALSEHNSHLESQYPKTCQYSQNTLVDSQIPHPELIPSDYPGCKRRKLKSVSITSNLDDAQDRYCKSSEDDPYGLYPGSILETDPDVTSILWDWVRMPSQADEEKYYSVSGSRRLRSSKAASEATTEETTGSGRGTRKRKEKVNRMGPYDAEFRDEILAPRGITITIKPSIRPDAHFQVDEAKGRRSSYYTEVRGAVASPLWLEPEGSATQTFMGFCKCYASEGLAEAEFALNAAEELFKKDPLAIIPADTRQWRARRMVELVAKPADSVFWKAPPIVGDTSTTKGSPSSVYDFDIRPDCAYWLSIQAFNPDYVDQVIEWCFVMKGKMTCPYLTIEFKKDASSDFVAENQVAAAGSMALYNRFCLKREHMQQTQTAWSTAHLENIRHYGITMMGVLYLIWCFRPVVTPSFEWAGCDMTRVWQGSCITTVASVQNLFNWINEIHCWGLTVHGPECEKDVKLSMQTTPSGSRVSDVSMVIREKE